MQVEEPGSQGLADSALEARAQVGLALVFGEACPAVADGRGGV